MDSDEFFIIFMSILFMYITSFFVMLIHLNWDGIIAWVDSLHIQEWQLTAVAIGGCIALIPRTVKTYRFIRDQCKETSDYLKTMEEHK